MHQIVLTQIGGPDKLANIVGIVNLLIHDVYPDKTVNEMVELLYRLPVTIAVLPTINQALALRQQLETFQAVTTIVPLHCRKEVV